MCGNESKPLNYISATTFNLKGCVEININIYFKIKKYAYIMKMTAQSTNYLQCNSQRVDKISVGTILKVKIFNFLLTNDP